MSSESTIEDDGALALMRMTANVVASYVSNNNVSADAIPDVIRQIHRSIHDVAHGAAAPTIRLKPAVAISKSVTADHIICLEDGKKLKMLKRYLRSHYDLSPEDYRRKWNLPASYPMTAPNYAARRSAMAKKIGLGTGVRRKRKAR